MQKVHVILGPTSIGKTSLALEIAKELDADIISADSRQIYKDMDVGTGKIPTKETKYEKKKNRWEINGVKVWGYDLATPDEIFSSYDFAGFALNKIAKLHEKGKSVLLVGGTGFYVDMVTGRIKPSNIPPDIKLRKTLGDLSLEELQEKLSSLNPKEYKRIDENNPARIIRALEKSLSKKRSEPLNYLKKVEFEHIGLEASREHLYGRADAWALAVWKNGLLKEVKALRKKYKGSNKLNGIVYKEAIEHLDGKTSDREALQKIKFALHGYIRRQETYFKKIPEVYWVNIEQDNFKQNVYNRLNG